MMGHCFLFPFSNLVLDAISSSAIILLRKRVGCFTLIVTWMWLSVYLSLPHGVVGQQCMVVTFPGYVL